MQINFVYDVIYPFSKGGVEKRIWEVSTLLAEKGHDVHIFGMKYWEGETILEKGNLTLHGVCPPQELYRNGRRGIREAITVAARALPHLLREEGEIIDCQNFPYFPCFSSKASSIVTGTPLIITWHEVWGEYWYQYLGRKGMVGKTLEKILFDLADHSIAVSPTTKHDLEANGMKAGITLVPNGIHAGRIHQIPPATEECDIIYAGRLIREKNIDLLIRALHCIKKEIPDICCIIIGEGPEKANLMHLTHTLGLDQNVVFYGYAGDESEVYALMKASKVFAFPSVREGFGMVALEAMACGIPVVTVDHPRNAAVDLITEDTGLICRQTPGDLAEKLLIALHSADRLGTHCRMHASAYDWKEIVNKLERVYRAASP
jgi:glycosyltransferase involved in cell wall biosynthesis